MAAMQGVSAGIGVAQNLRRHHSPWLLRDAVMLLFVANFINIGVVLAAMGAAVRLFADAPETLYYQWSTGYATDDNSAGNGYQPTHYGTTDSALMDG
ncbi:MULTISPECIES: hypothetical protein [Ochrobactrum]|uniref:Uncharacterized protein n=1 Tax=Ochrobactrum chromiisoli TaxID=2993941 RepID=A0ABT3QPA8_9HYPH|nr:hypothetical protein [Ochrobactrum chromiisoli]MCX2697449.1 hypothetical protein [Ochrobactrum chromiisoli]